MTHTLHHGVLLTLLLATNVVRGAPICVPAHPLTRAELYREDDTYEKMSNSQLQKLAGKNDAQALNMLGIRYGTGTKVKKDSVRSFDYYRRGAELGMPGAQANLAFMYLNGEGTAKDEALAYSWARKSADAGDRQGQELVGYMLGKGVGTTADLKEAAFCYLLSARQGNANAQRTLANLYNQGYGIPVDLHEASTWRSRAREAAATQKPWFDETPLTAMPAEWTPSFEFVDEIAADAEVRTHDYSFRVAAPTKAMAKMSWARHRGTSEPRNTALLIGLQGYDTYGVLVEAQGKLAVGETIMAAAQRVRPVLKFQSAASRADCALMDSSKPFLSGDLAVLSAVCLNSRDQEIYVIGVSRKSLTFAVQSALPKKDIEELAAELETVLTSFRFE